MCDRKVRSLYTLCPDVEVEVFECPFCGGTDLKLIKEKLEKGSNKYITCLDCKGRGPIDMEGFVAIHLWNKGYSRLGNDDEEN